MFLAMKFFSNQIEFLPVFDSVPQRIVSLVPSQTELLYDLGLGESLVGITKFCIYPDCLQTKIRQVGGTKKVNFEKIKLLNPDIIVCNKEENTLEMVLELSKICTVLVTDIANLEDNIKLIKMFGTIFNKTIVAQKWINEIDLECESFRTFISSKLIRKTAYFIWKNPYMVAGSGTFIDEMLRINNFENIYGNLTRYPEIELEKMEFEDDLDLILLSSEPYPFKEKDFAAIQKFNLKTKIILVDGAMFSWYGNRVLKAFDYFRLLHAKI